MDSKNPKEDMLSKKAEEHELCVHQNELEIQNEELRSELKNIRKALKDSENYREIFFNDHTVMMLIDPVTGNITDANIAASNFYGYNREELIKMNIVDINVSDADSVIKEMQKAISKQQNYFIFKHRLSDGKIRDVDVCSGVINQKGKDLLYSIVNDITTQKDKENQLLQSEEKYRTIIETANEGILIGDTDGTITFANERMSEMLGYTKDELIGIDHGVIIDHTNRDFIQEKINNRKIGIKENYELELIRKDGKELWTLVNGTPLYDHNGVHDGNLAMYSDITELKRDEEKLKLTMAKLEHSNKELEHFAYIASHDLREPLRMITTFLQLLEKRYSDKLDNDANEFIGFAVDGSKRLNEMINDLLEYSKVTSKEIELKPVNLEKVLKNVLIHLKVQINENNAIITNDPLPIINCDENLMFQLFQNIITNAIKYQDNKIPKIHISTIKQEDQYLFSVKDNGIGIDAEHLKRIFTIFQRLHANHQYEGTGIGLAIAHKIVEQHDGKIWAESEVGKGTIFYFTIPITEQTLN